MTKRLKKKKHFPLLTDLSLAMRTDPSALITGTTEFVTVIYGPAVTFRFPDVKVEAYRRSVLHLNLFSAVDGSALNWCEQNVLRELMSAVHEEISHVSYEKRSC